MTENSIVPDDRFNPYIRAISLIVSYAVLCFIWLIIIRVFFGHMVPRIEDIFDKTPLTMSPPCAAAQCDFSVFWPAGILARLGRYKELYDPSLFEIYRNRILLLQEPQLNWFYPPPSLLPVAVISYLPFGYGFGVWTIALTSCAVFVLRLARLSWNAIVLGLLSPAALWCLELGQFGLVMGAALVSGLLLAETRPLLAGSILGMLIFKPQYGVLIPIILMAMRNWRGMIGFITTTALIAVVATVFFGWFAWSTYLLQGLETSKSILEAAPQLTGYEKFGVSAFWMTRSLGGNLSTSYMLQVAVSVLAITGTYFVWRQKNFDLLHRMSLTVFFSLLVTPYGYTDDMVGWSIALVVLAQARNWRIGPLDALFWLWPMLCPIVFLHTKLLFTPVVVIVAIARFWHRAGIGLPHLPRFKPVLPRAG